MTANVILALTQSCFLLHQIGVGEIRRNPSSSCGIRVTPQSTFKIPHALAALDAGVIDLKTTLTYDGHAVDFPAWQKDHSLATAMRFSVVWFFQAIAERLGVDRERKYLEAFDYGNRDSSSGLTTFWLGGSLAISPEEQLAFLQKLFGDQLPVKREASEIVRRILVQPKGAIVNAKGEHPFAAPWPDDAVVSAKTGAGTTADRHTVRWLVGHVRRGARQWLFVSNAIGDDLPPYVAVDQAEEALIATKVLR